MPTEFEAKFLDIVPESFRQTLTDAGFECFYRERLMRRRLYKVPGKDYSKTFVRLRDEGYQITVSHKSQADEDTIDRLQEAEMVVKNFDDAHAFLVACGFIEASYQENRREEWRRGKVKVDIDTWPGLNTYVEVEGPDEDAVRKAAGDLGFDYSQAIFGLATEVYKRVLGYSVEELMELKVVTFEEPPPPPKG